MCGILGFFTKTSISKINISKLINTKNILLERGPDDYGFIKENNYFLSNSRLRIIDKKKYNLPINKHNCIISFSGEILNYHKLKIFLKNQGYSFFTNTDTELILSLYHFYGENFLNYLEGFFSIAIFDKNKKKLLLAVDRFGNKSLFYSYQNDNLFFSSQQSYLIRSRIVKFEENQKKIDEFVIFGDIANNETLHKKIKKILPGTLITYDFKNINIKQYYSLEDKLLSLKLIKHNNLDKFEQILFKAIKLWNNNCKYKKSIMLSGGIDSGLLSILSSTISNEINTYTANFNGGSEGGNIERFNEHNEVKKILKKYKYNNSLVNFDKNDTEILLNRIYSNFEEPLPSSSMLLYKISQSIQLNDHERVCFTGDGLDEIFGGYLRHEYVLSKYKSTNNLEDILYGMNFLSKNRLKFFFNRDFNFPLERIEFLKKIKNYEFSNLDIIYLNDIKFYLPMFLRSAEIIGMKNSIEFRAPFTDRSVIENSFLIEDKFRKNKLFLKLLFRRHLKKRFEKKKLFSTPFLNEQLKNGFYFDILQNISKNSKVCSYFSIRGIKKMLQDHKKNDHSNFLMRLLTLHLFLESKY
jgi:asparagine synthase (glutamine-hydrolysing)